MVGPGQAVRLEGSDGSTMTADLVGTELRDLCVDGQPVLNRLYVALRDASWGTVGCQVEVLEQHLDAGELRLVWQADHRRHGQPVRWRGELRLVPGQLDLSVRAEVDGPLEFNRFGICVLHPLVQAGGAVRLATPEGPVEGELPRLVAPQELVATGPSPALGPFSQLDIEAGGWLASWRFEGDLFELEDQRNWTDASYKTYSTPLSRPRPQRAVAGQVIEQAVRLRLSPVGSDGAASGFGRLSGRAEGDLGPLSAGADQAPAAVGALLPAGQELSPTQAAALVGLGCDFVRCEAWVGPAPDHGRLSGGELPRLEVLETSAQVARSAGLAVELACHLAAGWSEAELAEVLGAARPDLVWVFDADARSGSSTECTGAELFGRAAHVVRRDLPEALVGGGTPFNFCELQRHDLAHLPAVAFAICPTVHADDLRSVRETPGAVPAILATLASRLPGALVEAGPLLGTERAPGGGGRGLPDETLDAPIDPVWFAAMVDALATSGAQRICTLAVHRLVDGQGRPCELGETLAHWASGRGAIVPSRLAPTTVRAHDHARGRDDERTSQR